MSSSNFLYVYHGITKRYRIVQSLTSLLNKLEIGLPYFIQLLAKQLVFFFQLFKLVFQRKFDRVYPPNFNLNLPFLCILFVVRHH